MTAAPRSVVARAVFPTDAVDEVLPLYVDGPADGVTALSRHGLTVAAGGAVSLGSYFNAFPAWTWQAESAQTEVDLVVRTRGAGSVSIQRSDSSGRASLVAAQGVEGEAETRVELPLAGFDDGGTYWFDLAAGAEGPFELLGAEWAVAAHLGSSATIAMATFNRNDDCLRQLATLAGATELTDVVDRVVVVDQGSDILADHEGFGDVREALGERLTLIRQPNLGGSGGFSRGMLEALHRAESASVLLLDDDAITEPEAVFRAIRFADAAREPVIVGGGMLHIDDRAVLYAQSEQWDERIGWVHLNRPGAYDHDFAVTGFRDAPFFHAAQRSDFNGWWMCLIPASLLGTAGLSLPLFLKGDDVEFALRAREHGVRTISPTGIALWHLGWGGKAPTRTWEAYFLHRNRLITELLHSPSRRPTRMLLHSFLGDMKPLLTLQYSAVRLRAQAAADVLAGPERLPGWLATRAAAIRALWSTFSDATPDPYAVSDAAAPAAPPSRWAQVVTLVGLLVRHLTVPARTSVPQAHVTAPELGWWTFTSIDAAVVDTADGRSQVVYRRDRRETIDALWRSIRLHLRLWIRWPHLSRRFRSAAPELASPEAWERVTGA